MARVVCIHGIAQDLDSRESLLKDWASWVAGGVSNFSDDLSLDTAEVDMAFYGAIFRADPEQKGDEIPNYSVGDLDVLEIELLRDLEGALAEVDTTGAKGGAVARSVGSTLQLIAGTPYFGVVAQRVVIWYLKQVRRYLTEPATRRVAQQALVKRIGEDTRVVIAHSLGSVAAYEALCEHPEYNVNTLITLGSPLGMPALLPRLLPPVVSGKGQWPGTIERWVNIADDADVVALRKALAPIYGQPIEDHKVNNQATMHDIKPYLTAHQTGHAVARALGMAI